MRRYGLLILALLAVVCLLFPAGAALARVGGGQSFGGGGSSGGGGGGDGGLVIWLIWLAISYPHVGVPLLIIVGIGWYLKQRHDKKYELPATTQQSLTGLLSGDTARKRARVAKLIDRLLEDDPNFSEILFLDFAQMIYTRFQEARGGKNLEGLKPYLSGELFERLEHIGSLLAKGTFEVDGVVVGSISIEHLAETGEGFRIFCEVEANYTEKTRHEGEPQREQAYYSRSRISFRRRKGALSKGPEEIRALGCPSCGSPIKMDAENLCAYCGQPAEPGRFHWELAGLDENVRLFRRDAPLRLGGAEVGTDFPTLFDPDLDVATKAFLMRYPGESIQTLAKRAAQVFGELQQAWTSGKWERARAFETDRLFQMHLFWMERYADQGYRNVLEQIEIQGNTLVKLARDAFFETATLRIKASMIDYTVDGSGNVKGGSKKEPRLFSEYWTFVRRSGFEPGKESNTSSCPSCGAPVKVAMNGRCEYCDANLSSGQFDWTLATIEQDEAYAG